MCLITRKPDFDIRPCHVAPSVGSWIADPRAVSSNPARLHTFLKVDHEMISSQIPPSADSFGLLSDTIESQAPYFGKD